MKHAMGWNWRLVMCLSLAMFFTTPAFAANYVVTLFEGGTGTGAGSFAFANGGSSGQAPASLSTNASSSAGVLTFAPSNLGIQVVSVDFVDAKPQKNRIKGNYVEGLTGQLTTPISTGNPFYVIDFQFAASGTNPAGFIRTYTIYRYLAKGNQDPSFTPVQGTYGVGNVNTIPEPESLALFALGLLALGWSVTHRRRPG